jgi:hypothetical protein
MPDGPRDLRKYSRQTNFRLILGGLALLYLVGGGLIYLIYGPAEMVTGLICMTLGLSPIVLVWFFLWIVGWVAKKANEE